MTGNDGIVTACSRNGGDKGWQLYSISRWNRNDAMKLRKYVELEFEKNKRRDIYWDDIPMFIHFTDFKLGIRVIDSNDLVEIDSLEDLRKIDLRYMKV